MTSPPGGKQSFSVLSSKPVSSGEPEFEWVRSSEGRVVVSVRLFEGTGGTENCSSPIASVADHRVIKTGIEVFFRWRRRGCKASWRRIVFDFGWKESTPPVVNWDVGAESGCVPCVSALDETSWVVIRFQGVIGIPCFDVAKCC
jgi:hypothetical protein